MPPPTLPPVNCIKNFAAISRFGTDLDDPLKYQELCAVRANLQRSAPSFIESRRFKKILVADGDTQLIALDADLPVDLFQAKQRSVIKPHGESPFLEEP